MADDSARILIAGVGNVLHGDDGFGVELALRLQKRNELPAAVKVIETGIGGMALIQELMIGYEALLLLDAYRKGGAPGRLYLLEPELADLTHLDDHQLRDYFADTHYATPIRALHLLRRIGRLPQTVRILGCEPENCERLSPTLSAAVAAALDQAVIAVGQWISGYLSQQRLPAHKPIV